ncbi:MAG: glycosyl hydrolase family 8, partial [Chitinispirillaceae bacterium]|nr:glycosyl hydrolase family 8 [Chitinispirillaceae bacterium]
SKIQGHGMMAWLTTCGGVSDAGSASDGDLDVAFSLVVASWQWGEEYQKEAIKVINTVKKLITDCKGVSVLYGGYGSDGRTPYGGCSRTDISYYTPAFFREFAKLTGDTIWKKLADDTYIVLNNGANPNTGLVPDWQTYDGRPDGNYGYDACRVPWRITLDYLWNGNEEAKKWCTKVATWAYKIGPANIKSGYNLDGSGGGGWPGMSYVGAFAVAAMAHSQEAADAFGKHIAGMSFDTYWYHAYLGNCYMLTLCGNMWRPGLSSVSVDGKRTQIQQNSFIPVKNKMSDELILSGLKIPSKVSLFSINGKRVAYIKSTCGNSASLKLSSLKSGCYVIEIEDRSSYSRHIITIY